MRLSTLLRRESKCEPASMLRRLSPKPWLRDGNGALGCMLLSKISTGLRTSYLVGVSSLMPHRRGCVGHVSCWRILSVEDCLQLETHVVRYSRGVCSRLATIRKDLRGSKSK